MLLGTMVINEVWSSKYPYVFNKMAWFRNDDLSLSTNLCGGYCHLSSLSKHINANIYACSWSLNSRLYLNWSFYRGIEYSHRQEILEDSDGLRSLAGYGCQHIAAIV
jgi:hypothetical protein